MFIWEGKSLHNNGQKHIYWLHSHVSDQITNIVLKNSPNENFEYS